MTDFGTALMQLWPHGDERIPGLRAGIIASAPAAFAKWGIDTPLLVAHVMAQISHECGAGHDVVENLNYSAARLPQVWPLHFNNSNAADYANNPQKLANYIYNPPIHRDLGNREGSNDGWTYRGRGASQTTGRANYARLADATRLDVLNNPDLVNNPKYFMECGLADFINCGCLPYAKRDDVLGVTKKLNGGTVGLNERKIWLAKWKAAIDSVPVSTKPVIQVVPPAPSPPDIPDIPRPDPVPQVQPAKASVWAAVFAFIVSLFKRS